MPKYLWPGLLLILAFTTAAFAQSAPNPKYREEMDKGRAAFDQRKFDDAAKHFKKAEKNNSGDWDAQFFLVQACMHLGDAKAVVENSRKLLELANDDTHRAIAHNLVGLGLDSQAKKKDKLPEAEQEFRTAIQLSPALTPAYFNLGKVLLVQGKDAEGLEWLKKYVTLDPQGGGVGQAKRFLAKPELARAELAPDFIAPTPDGKTLELNSFLGKVVLLDFWATWCGPCQRSLPEVRKLSHQFAANQFTVVSVSIDEDEGAWHRFVAKENMDWPQCKDEKVKIYESMRLVEPGQAVIPSYVLVSPDGAILKKFIGTEDMSGLEKRIQEALKTVQ
jgi:peroxiredoxin/Flp pilus assembly protein TadD